MTSTVAFPYRTIPPELIKLGGWQRFDRQGAAATIDDCIPNWDYDSHIDFGRSIELQPNAIIKNLEINDPKVNMSLIVTAETGPTSYRKTVFRTNVPQYPTWQHNIRFSIDSSQLAQRLSLATAIVLAGDVKGAGPITPSRHGSRLYRDSYVIQLEGSLGRFPMEMLDFRKGLPFLQAPEALWYLDWDPSRPESHFLGTVLLYVNSGHPEVSNLIQAAEPTILSILRCDVIRTMCQTMLQNDEFISDYSDYETESVGGQVREWLLHAFGDENPAMLSTKLENSPSRFESRLQSAFS